MKVKELVVIEYGIINNISEDRVLDYECTNSVSFINHNDFIKFIHDLITTMSINYNGDNGNYIEIYKEKDIELNEQEIKSIEENMCLDDDSSYKNNLIQQIIFNNNLGGLI